MFKNVAAKFMVFAFDATTNVPKTGDAANITAYVSKDYAAVTVLADTTATEMDATNAPGYYLFDAAQGETNADCLMVSGKSSTANIKVIGAPAVIYTRPTTGWLAPATAGRTIVVDASGLADANMVKAGPTGSGTAQTARDIGGAVPAAAAGAAGGLLISGSNSGTTTFGALTVTGALTATGGLVAAITGSITGNLSGSVGSVTGAVGSVTGAVGSVTGNIGGNLSGTLTSTERNAIVDALLNRDMSAVTDSTARSPLNALRFLRNKWSISGTTLTVTKEDDTTSAWTATVTATAGANPITANDPA